MPLTTAREYPTTGSYGEWPGMRRRSTRLVSPPVEALRQIEAWPAEHAAAGVATAGRGRGRARRHVDHRLGWGSVTKLLVAYATLIAAEEGALDLDEPAGPEGSTVRHLLAHASGLSWDGPKPIGKPGERRIYSNTGYLALAEHLARRAEMPFPRLPRARRCSSRSPSTRRSTATRRAGSSARSATCSRSGGRRSRRR